MPMRAEPASVMMVFTSAKSRLISPGRAIRSEMPCTPCLRTSSAVLNASSIVVRLSATCNRRSLGMVIKVSTFSFSLAIPSVACFWRLRPSKAKGFVTTPMVSAPSSLAHCATIGAAPVPVPPPMPAVTNTMSEPFRAFSISSRLSRAAFSPISGLAPAPSPLVSFSPMRMQ